MSWEGKREASDIGTFSSIHGGTGILFSGLAEVCRNVGWPTVDFSWLHQLRAEVAEDHCFRTVCFPTSRIV